MIIANIDCQKKGNLVIEKLNIELLFSDYKALYKNTFQLSDTILSKMARFKKDRGGYLVKISSKGEILAMFTLSFGVDNYFELGDVMKLDKSLPRSSFAKAMSKSTHAFIASDGRKGAYSYPNMWAVPLEKLAGYKEHSRYTRNISVILLGVVFLLPIEVSQGELKIKKDYFNHQILRSRMGVDVTRLSFFGISIYRKNLYQEKNISMLDFGILYEFTLTKDYGDYFLIYGDESFDLSKFGFEFCDNSA